MTDNTDQHLYRWVPYLDVGSGAHRGHLPLWRLPASRARHGFDQGDRVASMMRRLLLHFIRAASWLIKVDLERL